MALQVVSRHQTQTEQTEAAAEKAAISHLVSAAAAHAAGAAALLSSAEDVVGGQEEKQAYTAAVTATPVASSGRAAAGGDAGEDALDSPTAGASAAPAAISSVDVAGICETSTAGKADREGSPAMLQGNNKATLKDTQTIHRVERCTPFLSTCDDSPSSQIRSAGTCSWSFPGGVMLSSLTSCHADVQSPPFSAWPGPGDFFAGACASTSASTSSARQLYTPRDSTSNCGNMSFDDGESNSKDGGSNGTDGSNLDSSEYRVSATFDPIKSDGSNECTLTCAGSGNSSSSSSCESTRTSLDSTLRGYENNRSSDSGGSSFKGPFMKDDITAPVKIPQQPLEEHREAGSRQPDEVLPFVEDSCRTQRLGRGSVTYNGTPPKASRTRGGEGVTEDDLRLRRQNVDSSLRVGSRRRSSSCSVAGVRTRGKSRLTPGHLRLPQQDSGKEADRFTYEKDVKGEVWTCRSHQVYRDCATEKDNVGDDLSSSRAITEDGCGTPRSLVACSQATSESRFPSAAKQDITAEYTSKKSCLGLEHGGWSCRRRLSSSLNEPQREGPVSGDVLLFRNCCSSLRLQRGEVAATQDADAVIEKAAGGLNAPERRSSSRQGGGTGGSRGSSLLGLHKGAQQQLHQVNHSIAIVGMSSRDEGLPRSPGTAGLRTPKASGEDHRATGDRGGAAGKGGGLTERTNSGTKENTACKREDRWTSPFPGVKFCRSRNAWIARWSESGQEKWKTFPVKDSSFEEARRRALEFRQEKDRRKFERLWQQLNAEGLTPGSSGEMRCVPLSSSGSKLSGSDSSSGEGSAMRSRAMEERAEEQSLMSPKDTKSACVWQQQQSGEGADDTPGTPRCTRLNALRSSRLLHSAQRPRQRKHETQHHQQQQQPLQNVMGMGQEGVTCKTLVAASVSKGTGTGTPNGSAGCTAVDQSGEGRVWLSPGVYADTYAPDGGIVKEEGLLPPGAYFSNGWQHLTAIRTTRLQLQGAQKTFSTDSANSLMSAETGWLTLEDIVKEELNGAATSPKDAAAIPYREAANSTGGKVDALAILGNGSVPQQQQQYSSVKGLGLVTQAAADGQEGLAGGRVVEALLRVLSGEDGNSRKDGLCREKVALLLGDYERMPADVVARLPADETPVSRKRRSRDEDTLYTGSESTAAESARPTSLKILSMYKAALLLIMDDLMSNGLPLLVASGGGAALGADCRHAHHAAPLTEGDEHHMGDRKVIVEQSMRKMLEDQRRCIAEASLLGAVSPFVKLFETCILDQKLPSQADDSGRTQLVYLNALCALQELSLSVRAGAPIMW